MVGDGHTVSVAAQIVQHIFGATEGTFQVDHPVLSVAEYFGLSSRRARTVVAEVAKAVGPWRREAAGLGIARTEIEKMSSAFDHEDFKKASKH